MRCPAGDKRARHGGCRRKACPGSMADRYRIPAPVGKVFRLDLGGEKTIALLGRIAASPATIRQPLRFQTTKGLADSANPKTATSFV